MTAEDVGRLLISCPDRPGVVAAVSHFLFDRGANIIHSDQHSTERGRGMFLMRIEFQLPRLDEQQQDFQQAFKSIAGRFNMEWRLASAAHRKRLAIFVSRAEQPFDIGNDFDVFLHSALDPVLPDRSLTRADDPQAPEDRKRTNLL